MPQIENPVSKITAATVITGTIAATFTMFYHGISIPEAGYALIGGIVVGAGNFLFKRDKE